MSRWPASTEEERFWSKVNKDGPTVREDLGPCWVWTAGSCHNYGAFRSDGEFRAHRVSWKLAHGKRAAKCVLHHCDNPKCVRPSHLFEGTQTENVADMDHKGRRVPSSVVGEDTSQARLTAAQVIELRKLYSLGCSTQRSLAAHFQVSQGTVSDAITRKTWGHIP